MVLQGSCRLFASLQFLECLSQLSVSTGHGPLRNLPGRGRFPKATQRLFRSARWTLYNGVTSRGGWCPVGERDHLEDDD